MYHTSRYTHLYTTALEFAISLVHVQFVTRLLRTWMKCDNTRVAHFNLRRYHSFAQYFDMYTSWILYVHRINWYLYMYTLYILHSTPRCAVYMHATATETPSHSNRGVRVSLLMLRAYIYIYICTPRVSPLLLRVYIYIYICTLWVSLLLLRAYIYMHPDARNSNARASVRMEPCWNCDLSIKM